MRVNSTFIGVVLLPLLVVLGCTLSPEYGVNDKQAQSSIERLNLLGRLRGELKYNNIVEILEKDRRSYSSDPYSYVRILNELADIYTYQLLDMDKAIAIDLHISDVKGIDTPLPSGIKPASTVANNTILGVSQYIDDYIDISVSEIRDATAERIQRNRLLLEGERTVLIRTYTQSELTQHRLQVQRDLDRSISDGAVRDKLLSRFIRADLELSRKGNNILESLGRIDAGTFRPEQVDFREIDFISLYDYLLLAYQQTGDIRFAEHALSTLYKPYINIQRQADRWAYNKLINKAVSVLISANYDNRKYSDALYYANLNKSRMVLEETARFDAGGNETDTSIGALLRKSGSSTSGFFGIPSKSDFRTTLTKTTNLIDFYIDGEYRANASPPSSIGGGFIANSRDFGLSVQSTEAESFVDSVLYVTLVQDGRITMSDKLSSSQLSQLRTDLDSTYKAITSSDLPAINASEYLSSLASRVNANVPLTVVADKWLTRHPFDFHMNLSTRRAINLFSVQSEFGLDKIDLVGFYNPTLDLPGAELESRILADLFPSAKNYVGAEATTQAMLRRSSANIVHLSMHGHYNEQEPAFSKLYFHNAKPTDEKNDPNALYARDMVGYELLSTRDVVFAAACQTGITGFDQSNTNEILGMLRPLTLAKNKNIILSLWKVSDDVTAFFVEQFYLLLRSSKNVAHAFHAAQNRTKEQFPNPYHWAAFYLSSSS